MNDSTLLYEKIVDYLKNKIEQGEFAPGDRLPTEMELAEKFDVSRITSKRALEDLKNEGLIYRVRGSGSFVADINANKHRYREDVKENPYSRVISVVLPFDDSSGGIMDTISGISNAIREKGYMMDVQCNAGSIDDEKELLMSLYERKMGGIIYYPSSDRDNLELMNKFYLEDFPIITIDKYFESVPISYVVSDNSQGMFDAASHLLKLGHRNIAFISDNKIESATSVRNRYFGYTRALKEYGITINPDYVKNGEINIMEPEKGKEVLKQLVEQDITAICAINDYVAHFVVKSLKQMDILVPEQISVVGFDDLELSWLADVPLTTVHQDMYKIGECAGMMLLEKLEKNKQVFEKKVIPTRLIERQSCKRL